MKHSVHSAIYSDDAYDEVYKRERKIRLSRTEDSAAETRDRERKAERGAKEKLRAIFTGAAVLLVLAAAGLSEAPQASATEGVGEAACVATSGAVVCRVLTTHYRSRVVIRGERVGYIGRRSNGFVSRSTGRDLLPSASRRRAYRRGVGIALPRIGTALDCRRGARPSRFACFDGQGGAIILRSFEDASVRVSLRGSKVGA